MYVWIQPMKYQKVLDNPTWVIHSVSIFTKKNKSKTMCLEKTA